MSTTPGDSTWADAGLVPPDGAETPKPWAAEADVAEQDHDPAEEDALPTELPDDAGEADALEQHLDAGGMPAEPPRARDDAAEHDVLEQAQDVPDDDADDYPSA